MDKFYTLNGYRLKRSDFLTESQEDYLEMIYRLYLEKKIVCISDLANNLNVRYSSCSKMVNKLQEKQLLIFPKYKDITLTEKGLNMGKYLLKRHEVLTIFFKLLNRENYSLEQVEKIEHFVDYITINNIEALIKKM